MNQVLLKRAFWAGGVLLFLVGLAGWYSRITNGHEDANYGSLVPWGLWVAGYIYFIGLSAGSFLISSLVYVFNVKRFESIGRLAVFTAVVTLLLALLMIWVDLGHMSRAWEVLVYPNFLSPMAWMIWLYTAYFVLLIVELWFLVRADLVRGTPGTTLHARLYRILAFGSHDTSERALARDRRVVRMLATIGVPVAVMFHGGVGSLFAVVAARPLWNSGLFPILFLLSALASGGALLALVSAIFQDGLRRNRATVVALGQLVLALLALDLLLEGSEILVAFRSGVPDHVEAIELIATGPYWWVFWGWQLGVGTILPILILAGPTRHDARWVAAAVLLIAIGFIGVRLNIVIPGLAVEEVRGIANAIDSPRISLDYVPSVTEWLMAIWVVGFGLLLFGIGEYLMPRDSGEEGTNVPA